MEILCSQLATGTLSTYDAINRIIGIINECMSIATSGPPVSKKNAAWWDEDVPNFIKVQEEMFKKKH